MQLPTKGLILELIEAARYHQACYDRWQQVLGDPEEGLEEPSCKKEEQKALQKFFSLKKKVLSLLRE